MTILLPNINDFMKSNQGMSCLYRFGFLKQIYLNVPGDGDTCGCLGRKRSQKKVQPSPTDNLKAKKYSNDGSTSSKSNLCDKQEYQAGGYSDDDSLNNKYDPKY